MSALRSQDHVVTFHEGTWHELCFAVFVSGGEIAIENDAALRLDPLIFLGERSIRAEAEVVWCQDASPEQANSCLHRLKFTSLDLQDRLSLELFMAVAFSGKRGAGEAVVKEVRPRP